MARSELTVTLGLDVKPMVAQLRATADALTAAADKLEASISTTVEAPVDDDHDGSGARREARQ